ncbi:MAG: hypothetical protein IRZ16_19560 [Myxococcaceae bacterium]|nr:hypothetical protein [Myxococcaceae bacterium]
MTHFIRGAVAVLFLTSLGVGCAGTKAAGRDIASEIPGVSHASDGLVQEASENRISVVGIKDQPGPISFQIGTDTRIEKDGQRVALSELKPGTPVRVTWSSSTGAEKAYRIQVLTGGEAAKVRSEAQERGYGGAGQQGQ